MNTIALSELEDLLSTWDEPGDLCDYGCNTEMLDEMWKEALNIAGVCKSVIAVSDWIWFDIKGGDSDQSPHEKTCSIIKANNIVRLNTRRFDVGHWVRTSPLVDFHNPCFFETNNTIYILLGSGTRKEADESIFLVQSTLF
jgi:hypothetical protein